MDLKDFVLDENNSAELVVRHPVTDEPIEGQDGGPWTIRLASVHSKKYEKAKHKIMNRRLSKRRQGVTSQELDNATADVLAGATVGWDHPPTLEGELIEFSEAAAARVYREFGWLRDQVVRFVEDDSHFFAT